MFTITAMYIEGPKTGEVFQFTCPSGGWDSADQARHDPFFLWAICSKWNSEDGRYQVMYVR